MTNTTISIIFSLILSFFFSKGLFSKFLSIHNNLILILTLMWPLWVSIIFFISMRYVCPKFLSVIHYKSYEETYEVRTVDSLKEIKASDTIKELEISKYTKLPDYFWFYLAVIFYLAVLISFILLIKYSFEKHLLFRIVLTAPPYFVFLLWAAYHQLTTMWMDIPSYQVVFEPNRLIVKRHSKSDFISYSDI